MSEIHDVLTRVWDNLVARPSGPLALRFVIQPVMASIFAIRDGLKDARLGRSPYGWTILTDPAERRGRLGEGLRAVGKVVILALILDAIYQLRALGTFYPGEALIVTAFLAFVPYLLLRGPIARIARWWSRRGTPSAPGL